MGMETDGEGGEEEGRERKGRDGGGRGKVTEGMGGTGQDMGWDGEEGKGREEGEGKGGEGYSPKLQFLATPLLLPTKCFPFR